MQQLTSTQHLCVLHVATAGLQGPALGSDEEEIILLIYVIVDVHHNKVNIFTLLSNFTKFYYVLIATVPEIPEKRILHLP